MESEAKLGAGAHVNSHPSEAEKADQASLKVRWWSVGVQAFFKTRERDRPGVDRELGAVAIPGCKRHVAKCCRGWRRCSVSATRTDGVQEGEEEEARKLAFENRTSHARDPFLTRRVGTRCAGSIGQVSAVLQLIPTTASSRLSYVFQPR